MSKIWTYFTSLPEYLPDYIIIVQDRVKDSNLTIMGILISLIAVSIALWTYRHSRNSFRATVFLALRKDYLGVLEKLNKDGTDYSLNDPKHRYQKLSKEAKSALQAYWMNAFNEFIVTRIIFKHWFINKKDPLGLWNDFYASVITSARNYPLFEAARKELFANSNFSMGGYKLEFAQALDEANKEFGGGKFENCVPIVSTGRREQSDNLPVLDRSASDLAKETIDNVIDQILNHPKAITFAPLVNEARWLSERDGRYKCLEYQNQLLAACLALKAGVQGNFGVGAVLVDKHCRVISTAMNTVYTTGNFSCHAEMNLISDSHIDELTLSNSIDGVSETTLISSLEPCPMCLARISMTPIKNIIFLSEDETGGMVSRKELFPDVWKGFLSGKKFQRSEYEELSAFALRVFEVTKSLNEKLG